MNELLPNKTKIESNDDQLASLIFSVSRWGTIIGVVLVILGIVSVLLPAVTALAIEIWLAAMFLFVGAALLFQAFNNRRHGSVLYEIVWGVIYLFGGLVLLLVPKSGIITIALILGVVFVFDGIGKIALASKAFSGHRTNWWIVDGVTAILLGGLILWYWPGDSVRVVGMLVGLRLLFAGLASIMVANLIRPRIHSTIDTEGKQP